MNDIRISNDLRLTRIGASGCVLRSDMQELEGSEGIGIERDELMPFIKALYNVACLSLDPAIRVNQLARLLAQAQDEIELGW